MRIGQTIVVRSYGWGRYLGRLNLYLRNLEAPFVDEARIKTLERNLAGMKRRTEQGGLESVRGRKAHIEAQLREANRRGSEYTVILGEEEMGRGEVLVKTMEGGAQESVDWEDLIPFFEKMGFGI